MSRLSIGRLIAIAMVVTIVLLFSIDTTMACRYLWRSHYRSCAPVYYYCPPAPCRVVTTPSCGSTAAPVAPQPSAVQQPTELPEPPAEEVEPADAKTIDSPSDDTGTGFTEPDVSDIGDEPMDSLVDEPEIVDDLPDVDTPDDADSVFDLPDETTTDVPDETTTELPAEDDPLGDIFDEPTEDMLPGADTDLPAEDTDDPLGDIFDEPTEDALPATDTDLPTEDVDDPLGDIFDEPAEDALPETDTDLPADDADDPLGDIFDEPLPGDEPDAASTGGDEDELMNDLFGAEPADTVEPRVANNPDEDEDELFREFEEATDLDSDPDADLPADDLDADDLFPTEDENTSGGDGTSSEDLDDELNDLFSGLPEKETLGFREAEVADSKAVEPAVADQPREDVVEVAPREGVTRNVEQFKPAVRVWTDNTGMYKTVGRLVKIGESHVRLLKENGRFSTVPKRRLSQADLAYVQEMVKHLGIEELDYIARR